MDLGSLATNARDRRFRKDTFLIIKLRARSLKPHKIFKYQYYIQINGGFTESRDPHKHDYASTLCMPRSGTGQSRRKVVLAPLGRSRCKYRIDKGSINSGQSPQTSGSHLRRLGHAIPEQN
jgi:hypothetical protein